MSLSNIYEVLVSIYIRLMKLKYVRVAESVLISRIRRLATDSRSRSQ